MTKIEKLSDKQIAAMAECRDKWIRIGLNTAPANRAEAEEGVREAYKIAGLDAPKIVWCDSPLSMGLTRAIVQKHGGELAKKIGASVRDSVWDSVWDSVRDSVRASVGASVGDSVRDSVRASVGASVRDSVRASVRASVWDSVRDSVRASVGASVGDSVRDSVRDSVWDSVRDSVRASVGASVGDSVRASVGASVWDSVGDSVWDSGYGQHDANWLAYYEFFFEQCGLEKETIKLDGLWKIAKNAGWFLPHKGICWISERHCVVLQDEQKRLHCETGPAVKYPDGFRIHAWRGVRVPQWVIESPAEITPEKILKESNAEVRRVMAERFGFEKFGKALIDGGKAKLIDEQNVWGEPVKYYHYNDGDATLGFIHVINGTVEPDGSKHEFILTVKADNDNAEKAVFSTYPELMQRIANWPNKWDVMRKSIRS